MRIREIPMRTLARMLMRMLMRRFPRRVTARAKVNDRKFAGVIPSPIARARGRFRAGALFFLATLIAPKAALPEVARDASTKFIRVAGRLRRFPRSRWFQG